MQIWNASGVGILDITWNRVRRIRNAMPMYNLLRAGKGDGRPNTFR